MFDNHAWWFLRQRSTIWHMECSHSQTHKPYTSSKLWAFLCPFHFSLHHRKDFCLRLHMLTLRHLELLMSRHPLHPLTFGYHKAGKQKRRGKREFALCVCVCSGEVKLTSCENRHGWTLASTGPEGT